MRRFRAVLGRPLQDKPTKTGFQCLAEELIQQILRHLHWPTDFYNISLVSRMLYRNATHELYSTLVVAYHRPERINALLVLLQTRPEWLSLITTLVFDEDVKSLGPNLPDPPKWPPRTHRRELADGWDSFSSDLQSGKTYAHNIHHENIARRLQVILPSLRNLRLVVLRNLHPRYMRLGLPESLIVTTSDSDSSMMLRPAQVSNIWECLFGESSLITELFVNGITSHMPTKTMLSRLTVVSISDLFLNVDGHAEQACAWNAVLSEALSLQTLGMIHVEHAHVILDRRFFPRLEALELYKVFLGYPQAPNPQVFIEFLCRHSPTLRVLALSSHLWGSINYGTWLRDQAILPNLQTLRLDNIFALLYTDDEGPSGTMEDSDEAAFQRAAAIQADRTNVIIDFIRHRPNILDVGITALSRPESDKFAQFLAATRPMRNIFIGEKASDSLRTRTSSMPRYWDYSYETWAFYQLFGGLTIGRSGFRPKLPPQLWKFWKKT